jgi:alpha-L-fucosidase 2
MKPSAHSIVSALLAVAGLGHAATTGPDIVAKHSIVLNAPVGEATKLMARGPLLGNGDVGVMQSGPADSLTYFIGKNDFWSTKHQAPIAVGQMRIVTPALQGAAFKTITDMSLAEIRGEYSKSGAALSSRAWVDANRNLFCVELSNKGSEPLAISLQNIKGASASDIPSNVQNTPNPVKIGCEQANGGRWFFNGEMADVEVSDKVLPLADITKKARNPRRKVEAFDGKSGRELSAPVISKTVTISGWIKAASLSPEADYIVSKGEWNQGYSLGLSQGHLRFSIGGFMLQLDEQVPLNQWVHVAGVFDGKQMAVLLDGKVRKSIGSGNLSESDFLYHPDAPNPASRKVGVATRVIGAKSGNEFTLAPGKSAVVVTAIQSDLDAAGGDPLASARNLVSRLTPERLAECSAAHRKWWREFWSRSFIEIPDKTIEQCWYSSWYIMASCSRAGKVAPGLWGNWLTVDNPAWHGDFHLNYNFQAPFYGLYSSNHADTTLPFYEAMNQMIPRGREIAKKRGWQGIHLPVSMGPWGMCPEGESSDWGQRSNSIYSALNYITHWNCMKDEAWLKTEGYPYLREVAVFWENYLKFKDGRYVDENDAIHEGHSPADVNPIFALGALKTFFTHMPAISDAAGMDADKRAKWRDIHDKLSPFPTQERGGKTVFRYTEKGTAWWGDNTVGIQHIFPAGAIGLDSDPKLLEISRNMIDAMGRWRDSNGMSSWYTACARIGYDPRKILAEMRRMYDGHTLPNKLLNFGGGGIENVSPALAVTEMLMQSHEGVIRLYPCWPKDQDARFGTLRAVGAFLVSAELKAGIISGFTITSEKGKDCVVLNPWSDKKVRITRNGVAAETVYGERFTLKTKEDETLALNPE